ncbi:hypothetical protein NVP1101O_212 [Vibrio phage 1.101.O._10N.261.45.C6]|nr:hypothetical protein NVP1101O_212 [Vibrio phage 1.101.O._10N.261.45.C6]
MFGLFHDVEYNGFIIETEQDRNINLCENDYPDGYFYSWVVIEPNTDIGLTTGTEADQEKAESAAKAWIDERNRYYSKM